MKDLHKMSESELCELYYSTFGDDYAINWDCPKNSFNDDIINCIETNTPQDMSNPKYPWNNIEYDPEHNIVY